MTVRPRTRIHAIAAATTAAAIVFASAGGAIAGVVQATPDADAALAAEAARQAVPMRGFIYLEPFEVRAEYVLRLAAFPERLPVPGDDARLDEAEQLSVLSSAAALLEGASRLQLDGETPSIAARTIQFIQFDADGGPVLDERSSIPVSEAIVAAVFAGERPGFPGELEISWSLFAPGDVAVPVELEAAGPDESHAETLTLTRAAAAGSWTVPPISMLPPPQPVPAEGGGAGAGPLVAGLLFGAGALGLALRAATRPRGERRGPAFVAVVMAGLGVAAVAGLAGGGGRLEREEARDVVGAVLGNVYQAFAYPQESVIFDTLALSVEGPLLEELYLDVRRAFEIEEAGGPRVKVLELSLIDCQVLGASGGRVRARAIWACSGTVSHWGHVHQRRNQYRGELTLEPVDGDWKLIDVTILEEQRI